MGLKTLWRSFAGGVITPEMYGRKDLAKYQTGLAECLNFRTLPHGPAERRPGFRFVNQSAKSATAVRLIPFAFSATQTMVLEFGDLYIRFHSNRQTLLETDKAIVSIVGNVVTVNAHGWSTNDWVFIGGRFFIITVTGANTFTVVGLRAQAALPTPSATTAARVYTLVSPYAATDIFGLHYAQNSDVLTLTHPLYAATELRRLGATNWTLTPISFAPTLTPPTGLVVTPTIGTPGNQNPQSYCVTVIDTDGVTESLASATVSTSNNLSVAGNFNTVQANSTAGLRYNFFKQRGGAFGYIGQVIATGATVSIVDDNVLPDTTKTPPEDIFDLNSGPGDYPSAVTYYEQRRWFAGTVDNPQGVWATRSGTESNLTSSVPSQDDDGMEFRIAARQQNAILHLAPLSDMLALTVGAEFRIFADNAPAITPTSLSTKPQGYSGASNVQPVVTSGSMLYVQSQGTHLREMAYNWQSNAYASTDISIFAPNLFDGFSITDAAYSRAPVQELYAVRDDGTLLAMTHVPEQQVYGWHEHVTEGAFESVCVVAEGNEDVLYVVVRRTVAGQDWRYIERLQSRILVSQEDAFYVDSGLSYYGAPITTLTGFWHLEGQTLQLLTDGAVHPERTVVNGSITLEAEASVVHGGLGYVSDLETLPIILELPAAGDGVRKNVNSVRMRLTQSSAAKVGIDANRLVEIPDRDVTDDYDSPPALRSYEARVQVPSSWNADGSVFVRQDLPLPLTVLSMVLDVQAGG